MVEGKSLANSGEAGFQYHFLKDPDLRYNIIQRGRALVESSQAYGTLVFLDRSARPIAWIFEALLEKLFPYDSKPGILFLNTGQKDLRSRYMLGIGSAVRIDQNHFSGRFVGIYDTEENIRLFKQRVRSDEKIKQQLRQEIGEDGVEILSGKKILIVDEIEFEGVSRLFSEEIIDEVFSPQSIGYFEYGEYLSHLPTGLSEEEYDSSFIAKPSEDLESILAAEDAQREISNLVTEF